ncbi:hypothetical protein CV102_10260 [Natronococcus pandeyae]|uniref:Uncharacterized protein n=1 Tax=Natronococcus pandeyae TaxID=2055836 RepID=A0A8J8Q3R9_9EURY|nr:hypothetical protein CV102_10260 [Natronococcus pandeyae]
MPGNRLEGGFERFQPQHGPDSAVAVIARFVDRSCGDAVRYPIVFRVRSSIEGRLRSDSDEVVTTSPLDSPVRAEWRGREIDG